METRAGRRGKRSVAAMLTCCGCSLLCTRTRASHNFCRPCQEGPDAANRAQLENVLRTQGLTGKRASFLTNICSVFVIYGPSEHARRCRCAEIWDSDIDADDESGSVIISRKFPATENAAVHVSAMLSKGKFDELRSVMSREAVDTVRKQCKTLSEAQKRHLAISLDDIIFLLPEDVSVFFDLSGRKFLYITMRLWYLSSADVPEDPESTRIFKMDLTDEDDPQKKIITAVYE
ncbi:m-AAA protease-interacting mitochondrial-like protein [Labeo rohita]|uniref:M-AAA protease-interacting mitochondrial-like protein n=1 Tax=Labeo rohita TaxID=84645 RepID=A0A498MYL4_LABRO|nr:m-AAA protease-interacting mitochondrial-like protein [Labeo rohita]